jgi:hypothetical protein
MNIYKNTLLWKSKTGISSNFLHFQVRWKFGKKIPLIKLSNLPKLVSLVDSSQTLVEFISVAFTMVYVDNTNVFWSCFRSYLERKLNVIETQTPMNFAICCGCFLTGQTSTSCSGELQMKQVLGSKQAALW